jgi:uncharacterized protein (TIGR03435 family)
MDVNEKRVLYANFTLKNLIALAYSSGESRVLEGPGWMDSELYEINANLPPNTVKDQIPAMLQKLLSDRFKLAVNRESRTFPSYALMVAPNGPKLKASKPEEAAHSYILPGGRITGSKVPMAVLAEMLTRVTGRPVRDTTGLKGEFTFVLSWVPDNAPAAEAADPTRPSIYVAVQEQLGLKLQAGKSPVDVLVVSHAEKMPTAN